MRVKWLLPARIRKHSCLCKNPLQQLGFTSNLGAEKVHLDVTYKHLLNTSGAPGMGLPDLPDPFVNAAANTSLYFQQGLQQVTSAVQHEKGSVDGPLAVLKVELGNFQGF